MNLIGKKGNYTYFRHKGFLKLLDAMLPVQPDHIIAGGAPVSLLLGTGRKLKDIDVWVSSGIPVEATRESAYAWNYGKSYRHTPVQYIKVKAHKPSALLDTFDLDAAKCAFYNITPEGYDVCIHNYLKPIVYGKPPQGTCGVNPEAFNQFTLGRLTKYANRFERGMDMFSPEDYARAISQLDIFEEVSQTYLMSAVGEYQERYPEDGGYALLDHLRELFGLLPQRNRGMRSPQDRPNFVNAQSTRRHVGDDIRGMWDTLQAPIISVGSIQQIGDL